MTVKERILMIKLLERRKETLEKLGLQIGGVGNNEHRSKESKSV